MIEKTRGIVLQYLRYKESSIIVRIYTEEYGMQSFVVNGIRSQKSKRSIGNYQPFTLLEILAYYHKGKDIHRMSDSKMLYSHQSISANVRKGSVVLFLSEVVSRLLYHESAANRPLFQFLWDSIIFYDQLGEGFENFHLIFLVRLSRFVGFGIHNMGELVSHTPGADQETVFMLQKIVESDYQAVIQASGEMRYKGLLVLLNYYKHHVDYFGEIKSLKVLQQVFH
ncbi:MAG: DNA repair protein RecO [Cyclobacteriaceae bacterium]|nr:DNA repair protein RecO [Cyclobacteriaceae bacterium]